ncbi:MAG: ArsR/SmtB family transcription factor [Vicinamibacterales bacterium]
MGTDQNLPDEIFVIADLETLRIVANPLRLQILEGLRATSRTVKDLAAEFGLAATRLYYHVNLLEQHGLVRVTGSRLVSGIVEKHYQTTADRLALDRALLGSNQPLRDEGLEVLLSVVLDEARGEIRRSVREGRIEAGSDAPPGRGFVLGRRWLRLTAEQAGAYIERHKQLQAEFEALAARNNDTDQVFEVLLGFYPVERRAASEQPFGTGAAHLFAKDDEIEG